jgi:hypothetical protein
LFESSDAVGAKRTFLGASPFRRLAIMFKVEVAVALLGNRPKLPSRSPSPNTYTLRGFWDRARPRVPGLTIPQASRKSWRRCLIALLCHPYSAQHTAGDSTSAPAPPDSVVLRWGSFFVARPARFTAGRFAFRAATPLDHGWDQGHDAIKSHRYFVGPIKDGRNVGELRWRSTRSWG